MKLAKWAEDWIVPIVVLLATGCLFLLLIALVLSAGPR
jgi:hypothetical protein